MNFSFVQSVLKTMQYFDLDDYPLTKEELFYYLWQPPISYSDTEFCRLTELMIEQKILEEKYGYFFLPGRSEVVEKRRERLVCSELFLKKAYKAVKYIRNIPFLKAIFVCNSVGREVASSKSDIDFFIITLPNRIWLVRFFTNFILRFFGLRTYGNHEAGKICLSFYVDLNHLDLASYCVQKDDIHFAYWMHQMLPVYDPENLYTKFIHNNFWTKEFLPNIKSMGKCIGEPQTKNTRIGTLWKKIWEKMWTGMYGDILEKEAQKFQWHKLKLSIKEKAKLKDCGVVLAEGVLKFHEHDARKEYYEKWSKRCQNIVYEK